LFGRGVSSRNFLFFKINISLKKYHYSKRYPEKGHDLKILSKKKPGYALVVWHPTYPLLQLHILKFPRGDDQNFLVKFFFLLIFFG